MESSLLDQWIGQFGYAAMFLALCLGIIGIPVPNEIVVMTAGVAAGTGYFLPLPAFAATYAGVVSGISFGYAMGRLFGPSIVKRLMSLGNRRIGKGLSGKWSKRYDGIGLSLSYFIPLIRHLMPYLTGMNKMPYGKLAVYAYGSGFVWTLIYFLLGYYAGNHIRDIEEALIRHGSTLLWLIAVLGSVFVIVRSTRSRERKESLP
ncbi:DedA family protein [Cohnella lupini]|uniref:Membrane protein DedA with SNARE-associated domain n=1 Tax=Cohnella lupini TaxID=1294267 RepID=A0A3D9I6I2_9BACL|nr:DedA family protein [Cohnella lupini]RED57139.1 membrane protein DedA with SNARE-associated domain [Cohnella lupini]